MKRTKSTAMNNPANRVKQLQKWYRAQARDLPWRRDGDLYSIWLSEIMLQQTQVATVIPYYLKFKAKFPRVEELARASIDDVYLLWAGLGYYSRARNLHRGAQAIAERIDSGLPFPQTREEWLEIPGVGPYTAGAICSIGLNLREPIVDGNVVRVLSRLDRVAVIDAKATQIWSRARALVESPPAVPRDLNQALMELGATVCRPKNPLCGECPVAESCGGRKSPEKYPPKKIKTAVKQVTEKRWIILHRDRVAGLQVLLIQNQDTQWRKGLWDLPSQAPRARAKFIGEFESRYQVTNHKVQRHHQVLEVATQTKSSAKTKSPVAGGEWFNIESLPAVPAPVAKALKRVQE